MGAALHDIVKQIKPARMENASGTLAPAPEAGSEQLAGASLKWEAYFYENPTPSPSPNPAPTKNTDGSPWTGILIAVSIASGRSYPHLYPRLNPSLNLHIHLLSAALCLMGVVAGLAVRLACVRSRRRRHALAAAYMAEAPEIARFSAPGGELEYIGVYLWPLKAAWRYIFDLRKIFL